MANPILIIGNGFCAGKVADFLLQQGSEIIMATGSDKLTALPSRSLGTGNVELLTKTTVVDCRAHEGDFKIRMKHNGNHIARTVGTVVISEEWIREGNFSHYDLKPSPTVLSLTAVMEKMKDGKDSELKEKRIAFLTGVVKESNPVILSDVLETAHKLQSAFQAQTYLFCGNLKVAGNGLERFLREVRKSGSVVFKFNRSLPEIEQESNGRTSLTCHDEVTGLQFTLDPDILVVDESMRPSDTLANLSRIFRLHTGPQGFIQTDNTHRLSVFTNRDGILAVGPSRRIQSIEQQQQDAAAAVIAIHTTDAAPTAEKAEINTNECVRCLTCYRICPHRAITFSEKVTVEQNRCEGCGICAAECPREAIRINGLPHTDLLTHINRDAVAIDSESNSPYIVVFGCSHSAGLALESAVSKGDPLPENIQLISVPCAGSISINQVLLTFLSTVDGILILSCHDGNCHSEIGNKYMHLRVKQMETLFAKIGFQKERLEIQTLAANMPFELIKVIKLFEKRIAELGAR